MEEKKSVALEKRNNTNEMMDSCELSKRIIEGCKRILGVEAAGEQWKEIRNVVGYVDI